jgi:hypothetical protein
MVFSTAGFPRVFPEKRLELKSRKGQTKAEELGQVVRDIKGCTSLLLVETANFSLFHVHV